MSASGPPAIEETPQSDLYEHFRSISKFSWVPRLLSATRIRELCPLPLGAEPREGTWFHLDLALPVVHFGVFPNGATPLEQLLGLEAEVIDRVIRGPREAGPFTFLVLEPGTSGLQRGAAVSEEIVFDDASGLVAETGGLAIHSLLKDLPPDHDAPMSALLQELGKSPAELCLTTLPLLPLELARSPELAELTAALTKRNSDIARLIEINRRVSPAQRPTMSMTMQHQNYALQAAYDNFFIRMCEHLSDLFS